MKLLGSLASPYARKVRVVLAEKKIECELELVDVNPVDNPVNASNPLGKVPTLVLDDGTALYDSRVIVEFLDARSPINRLIPDETRDRVGVRRWEALADGVLDAGLLVRYETLRDKRERSQVWTDKQVARMHRGMALMAKEIEGRNWCHGDRYSLADIAVGCAMGWLGFRKPGEVDWEAEYGPVARHYKKVMDRPAFAETVPQVPK
ncbi:MAG TPA: glutathione S-transferase N-terminal domain-containing protein [Burkholderiales bacterium]|nr:glutathione S-transferase N-terminal domain-containing protein [Burkholderiales bacterium]